MIATQGIRNWDALLNPPIRNIREEFLRKHSAFWSNGHQIERDVKEANHCKNTKRSEAVTSIYSIARSMIVSVVNKLTTARRKLLKGGKFDDSKRNDDTSYVVSITALNMMYDQYRKVLAYPASHLLSNSPSLRASIKDLPLKEKYKKEIIRCKLEHRHQNKDPRRRKKRRTETHTSQNPSQKREMTTPLVQGNV